jgi:hypothetical protein
MYTPRFAMGTKTRCAPAMSSYRASHAGISHRSPRVLARTPIPRPDSSSRASGQIALPLADHSPPVNARAGGPLPGWLTPVPRAPRYRSSQRDDSLQPGRVNVPQVPESGRAAAANLAEVLDFTSPTDLTAPQGDVPAFAGLPCPTGQYADYENWHQLAALARAAGWPVGTKSGPSPALTTGQQPRTTARARRARRQGRAYPAWSAARRGTVRSSRRPSDGLLAARRRAHHQRRGLAASWA